MGGHLTQRQQHIHLAGGHQPVQGLVDLRHIPVAADLGIGREDDRVGAAGHAPDFTEKQVSGRRKPLGIAVVDHADANGSGLDRGGEDQGQADQAQNKYNSAFHRGTPVWLWVKGISSAAVSCPVLIGS